MKIVTAAEMREIDRLTTELFGVPSLTLMENAGTAVAEFAQKHFEFKSVCVVCGKGNNGGDGFVAARKLHEEGKQVAVIVLAKSAEELRGDAAEMFKKLAVAPIWIGEEDELDKPEVQQAFKAELIVDAILGTGFKPPLQGLGRKAVEVMNRLDSPVLAVDLPSGAYSDSFLSADDQGLMARADGVVTFTAPKPFHAFANATRGPVAVASIGSPFDLTLEYGEMDMEIYAAAYLNVIFSPRAFDAHKGDFGHILVVGGSVGKAGAAAMAGMAALRAGAGLVTVACPRSVQPTVAAFAPELMTEPLAETDAGTLSYAALERIEKLAAGKDAMVLGPGLSRNRETDQLIRALMPRFHEVHVVLDADGLNAFEGHSDELRREGLLIMTPHPGELARVRGSDIHSIESNRLEAVRDAAIRHQAVVVLKGHRTLTATPAGQVWVNMTGNPGMAKGGSGDVLSGIVAASLHQMQGGFGRKVSPKQAARLQELRRLRNEGAGNAARELEKIGERGAFDMFGFITAGAVCLHGLAGDVARDRVGEHSMIASDIMNNIGEAIAVSQAQIKQTKFLYLQR